MTNNDIGPERRHDSIYSNYPAHNSHFNIRIYYHLLSIHVVLTKKIFEFCCRYNFLEMGQLVSCILYSPEEFGTGVVEQIIWLEPP